jgi:ribulose-phosphate 3-epimerase
MSVRIAPSILSADFLHLEREIAAVEAAGADYIHIDVMDGHFVPNITMGPLIVKAIKSLTKLPLDVHLMIENVDSYVGAFAAAGSDIITFHVETGYHHARTVDLIKSHGKMAGLAVNPATPLALIEHLVPEIDLLLIMSVNPGFGGQSYLPWVTAKIAAARRMIDVGGKATELEVDGGLKEENTATVTGAGATVLVMGTEVFGVDDYAQKIANVRKRVQ